MLLLLAVFLMLLGVATGVGVGVYATRDWHTRRSPTAQERALTLDGVALARDLLTTPDRLDLFDRAANIVARHEAATLRKDT